MVPKSQIGEPAERLAEAARYHGGLGVWSAGGGRGERVVERAGAAPELVAYWRMGVGREAPRQPLDLERLLDGGALGGPMFEPPARSLGRRLRRLVRSWSDR